MGQQGRHILDHASWVGKGADGTVFPNGSKMKKIPHGEGFGRVMNYEDTDEQIVHAQEMAKDKLEKHNRKFFHRN